MLIALYIISVLVMIIVIMDHPYVLVRPSFWFVILMLIRINAAAAFAPQSFDALLVNRDLLRLLTVVFPFGVILWTLASAPLNVVAQDLYYNCKNDEFQNNSQFEKKFVNLVVFLFFLLALVFLSIYFKSVPLMSTGLVALITDPLRSSLIREESLKLVQSPFARYGFVWHTTVIAPILMVFLTSATYRTVSWKNFARICFSILLIVSVMLTGARYPGGMLILVAGIGIFLKQGLRRGMWVLTVATLILMILASVITLVREGLGGEISPKLVFDYVSQSIFRRVFIVPYLTGVWANMMAESHGLFGVSSIRPLAMLFNVEFVNFPNMVGLRYAENPLATINAGTCFLFGFQASFGLMKGWVLSLLSLISLDFLLLFFVGLRGKVLLAFLSALLASIISLSGSNFFTGLLSHGILPLSLAAVAIRFLRASLLRGS